MWAVRLAGALARKMTYMIIVLKDKLNFDDLTPELKTYYRLNLCIQSSENIDKITARIRYDITYNLFLWNRVSNNDERL